MELTYYQRVTLIALRDSLTRLVAMHTAMHVFGWETDLSGLGKAKEAFTSIINSKIVDGMLLTKAEDGFIYEGEFHCHYLTPEFLGGCNDTVRSILINAMAKF
jgi:hypothetical protein